MKTFSILLTFLFTISLSQAQSWKWESNPVAGENIMIHINDVPEAEEPLSLIYYCFEGTQLVAGDVGVMPAEKPGQVHAALALHDHVSWVRLVLKDKHGEILAADQQKVKNPKALPAAGEIEEALGSSVYARPLGIDAKDADVTALFHDAIQRNPKWLEDSEVFRSYYTMAKRCSSAQDIDIIKEYMMNLADKSNDVSEKLLVQTVRAAKDMEDSTLHLSLKQKLDKKYPHNILEQEDKLSAFTKAESVDEKIKIRDQFMKQYPVTKENKRMTDQMTSGLIQHYAGKDDWTNVKTYVGQIVDPLTRASVCNNYAWTLSGESIESEAPHLNVASDLSATSMKSLAEEAPVPVGMTKAEWAKSIDYNKAMYGDTYALILFKQGKVNEAIDHQLFTITKSDFADLDMNERYAVYLEKAGRKKEMIDFIDQIYVTGKASEKVKAIHRNYWTKEANQDQVYAQYISQLDARAKALRQDKLRKMWQEDAAVPFTLKDLSGKEVSLEEFKGKTVILDFWATWCGPCKASFPGMKKAVEHYAADENVVFLFIDTWERGEDVEKKVGDFISTNSYPFHVLMDTDFKVVEDYKVDGIPTKFIIGPDQKIRFTSVGYGGNNEELVEELISMIEMIQENTMPAKS